MISSGATGSAMSLKGSNRPFPALHYGMPQISYILTPTNMDDLVAYIVSLEGP